ncbi:MAG: PH domain-containing protein [Bacteroidales bacterium]|nr:PH domain-containing protein [Bacteroidales bacterium]
MENSIKPDPKYFSKSIWILVTVSGLVVVIAAILTLIFLLTPGDPMAEAKVWICAAGIIILKWIISYPIIVLWIKNLKYVIYDDRVSIHKGILTKTVQNIPFRAITDFALVRTLYDRALGIGSIKIQTAGKSMQSGSKYEGSLSGLLDYESLHTDLRARIRSLHPGTDTAATVDSTKPESRNTLEEILKELKEIRRSLNR